MADFNSYIQALMSNPNPQGNMLSGQSTMLKSPEQILQSRMGDAEAYNKDRFRVQNYIDSDQYNPADPFMLPAYKTQQPVGDMSTLDMNQVYKDASDYEQSGQGSRDQYIQGAGDKFNYTQEDITSMIGGLPSLPLAVGPTTQPGMLTRSDITSFSPEEIIASATTLAGPGGDPARTLYDYATKNGYTSAQIDMALGYSPGTTNAWKQSVGI